MSGLLADNRRRRGCRCRRRGFTLVELLVVLAIIAILITILMPSVGRARGLAQKVVCKSRLKNCGTGSAGWVAEYGSYPNLGGGNAPRATWPKFNGVMKGMGIQPMSGTKEYPEYQYVFPNELSDAVLCPSMDLAAMWSFLDESLIDGGREVERKACRFRNTIAFQWNFCLRGYGNANSWIPTGRWFPRAWEATYYWSSYVGGWDNTNQTDCILRFPKGTWVAQAVHPRDVQDLSTCAEAWDSLDPDTIPGMAEGKIKFRSDWAMESWIPGAHWGPATTDASGWAAMNGSRHQGSPNILYADGSVRDDATRRLQPADLPEWTYGGLDRAWLYSWPDYDPFWGSMKHIVPRPEVLDKLPDQP